MYTHRSERSAHIEEARRLREESSTKVESNDEMQLLLEECRVKLQAVTHEKTMIEASKAIADELAASTAISTAKDLAAARTKIDELQRQVLDYI